MKSKLLVLVAALLLSLFSNLGQSAEEYQLERILDGTDNATSAAIIYLGQELKRLNSPSGVLREKNSIRFLNNSGKALDVRLNILTVSIGERDFSDLQTFSVFEAAFSVLNSNLGTNKNFAVASTQTRNNRGETLTDIQVNIGNRALVLSDVSIASMAGSYVLGVVSIESSLFNTQ